MFSRVIFHLKSVNFLFLFSIHRLVCRVSSNEAVLSSGIIYISQTFVLTHNLLIPSRRAQQLSLWFSIKFIQIILPAQLQELARYLFKSLCYSLGAVAWSVMYLLWSSGPKIDPRASSTFIRGKKIPLPLIQAEQVVSYWRKNGH